MPSPPPGRLVQALNDVQRTGHGNHGRGLAAMVGACALCCAACSMPDEASAQCLIRSDQGIAAQLCMRIMPPPPRPAC